MYVGGEVFILIHIVSCSSDSSHSFIVETYLLKFFLTNIATPPPFFRDRLFVIDIYPGIFSCCFPLSFVSVIAIMSMSSSHRSDLMEVSFPFMPAAFAYASFNRLFFSIVGGLFRGVFEGTL